MWRIHWKNFLSDLDHFFMCFAGAACELQRQLVRTPKLLNIDLVPCELLVRSNRFRQRPFVTRPLRRTWSMCFVFRYMFQLKHSMQIFVWRFACFLCSSSKLEFGNPDVISCIRPKTNIAAAGPGQLLMLWMETRNHPKNGWKKYEKITLNLQQITSWMMNMMVKHLVFWRTLLSDKPNDGKKMPDPYKVTVGLWLWPWLIISNWEILGWLMRQSYTVVPSVMFVGLCYHM